MGDLALDGLIRIGLIRGSPTWTVSFPLAKSGPTVSPDRFASIQVLKIRSIHVSGCLPGISRPSSFDRVEPVLICACGTMCCSTWLCDQI